ncbi:retropepsin-like aspartic protease, partial [Gelidibacter salicanalis]
YADAIGRTITRLEEESPQTQVKSVSEEDEFTKPTPLFSCQFTSNDGCSFTHSCLPDTGATGSLIHSDIIIKYGIKEAKQSTSRKVTTANGSTLQT